MKYYCQNIYLWRVYISLPYLIPLSSGVYCPHPANGGIATAKPVAQVTITALRRLRSVEIPLQTMKTDPDWLPTVLYITHHLNWILKSWSFPRSKTLETSKHRPMFVFELPLMVKTITINNKWTRLYEYASVNC